MDEIDTFDRKGRQIDDINSVTEFVDQVVLGNKDATPEDEDDDEADYFPVFKIFVYTIADRTFIDSRDSQPVIPEARAEYAALPHAGLLRLPQDIISPPPEA